MESEPNALLIGRFGFSLACIELRFKRLQSPFLKIKFYDHSPSRILFNVALPIGRTTGYAHQYL